MNIGTCSARGLPAAAHVIPRGSIVCTECGTVFDTYYNPGSTSAKVQHAGEFIEAEPGGTMFLPKGTEIR